jgi:hypothetical protein
MKNATKDHWINHQNGTIRTTFFSWLWDLGLWFELAK